MRPFLAILFCALAFFTPAPMFAIREPRAGVCAKSKSPPPLPPPPPPPPPVQFETQASYAQAAGGRGQGGGGAAGAPPGGGGMSAEGSALTAEALALQIGGKKKLGM